MAQIAVATCSWVTSVIQNPGATDCAGAPLDLTNAQLVTCAELAGEVCTALGALPNAGPAQAATLLVGADCQLYTLPATPVDLNVTNFAVVGDNLELTDEDGSVFQIPLSSLVKFKDCNGLDINMAVDTIATCANVDSKIAAALAAPGATDCAGAAIDLTTAQLATCADLAALPKDQIVDNNDGTITITPEVGPVSDAISPIDTQQPMSEAVDCAADMLTIYNASDGKHKSIKPEDLLACFSTPGAVDCAGAAIDLETAQLATCADLTAAIASVKITATDCAGGVVDFAVTPIATCTDVDTKIDAALAAPGATDCAGAAIDLTTAALATCADLTAALAAPGATDCAGVALDLTTAQLATCAQMPVIAAGNPATITDPVTGTVVEIPQSVTDCAGGTIDLTDPATALATCADLAAAVAALQAQITTLTTTLAALQANTDTLLDCDGNTLATFIKPL